jgi:hypothetical protein
MSERQGHFIQATAHVQPRIKATATVRFVKMTRARMVLPDGNTENNTILQRTPSARPVNTPDQTRCDPTARDERTPEGTRQGQGFRPCIHQSPGQPKAHRLSDP